VERQCPVAGVDTDVPASVSTSTPLAGALTVDGGASVRGDVLCARTHVYDTVDSTSTTTGAVIVDGGASVAKNLYVGSNVVVTSDVACNSTHVTGEVACATLVSSGTTDSTSSTTGAVTLAGGLGVAKAVNCADLHASSPTTAATWHATDPLTGAFTVDGSASVRGSLLIGSLSVQTDADSTSVFGSSPSSVWKELSVRDHGMSDIDRWSGCRQEHHVYHPAGGRHHRQHVHYHRRPHCVGWPWNWNECERGSDRLLCIGRRIGSCEL
jgi:cytoskeletal protein CcmA (bactofilin family)